ncbi:MULTISPECIES: BrnT family toxin [Xenorhabdus]|uniref:BrnT family toxin n=1 Tax=Xenorhabdus TaxID=626 RepID=UPI0006496597|nr:MULTISPECIES: BrnT family toxin [Xenorhabdus]KLU17175.1 membrane protein [Xenorhabdus griffiniae]KOP32750.1 membrane protein [Xenorhabdus sp. GDc328]
MELEFEWDLAKAETNFCKHGIRFEEAARVFDDPFHLSVQDRFENGEYRWQTIGAVKGYLIVLVAHTILFEDGTEIIRIISARKAERNERKRYEHS